MNDIQDALRDFYSGQREIQCPVHFTCACFHCREGYLELAINNSSKCTLLMNQFVVDMDCPCVEQGKTIFEYFNTFIDVENKTQTEDYKKVTLRRVFVEYVPTVRLNDTAFHSPWGQ